ncbi:hypothetical protein P2318_26325 [Myxococcaceae bacterium GXIMD 01537]
MKLQSKLWGAVALTAALAAPLSANAQSRGRTDGPEGSEYGKGGYADPGGGAFSLEFNWGAAVLDTQPLGGAPEGPPLFIGATASFWGDDWYQLDVSGSYIFDGGRFDVLAGPRFRTYGWPLSLSLGVKAGLMYIPEVGSRFGVAPSIGADMMTGNDHILLGLGYSPNIPVGGGGIAHKLFMNIGFRF